MLHRVRPSAPAGPPTRPAHRHHRTQFRACSLPRPPPTAAPATSSGNLAGPACSPPGYFARLVRPATSARRGRPPRDPATLCTVRAAAQPRTTYLVHKVDEAWGRTSTLCTTRALSSCVESLGVELGVVVFGEVDADDPGGCWCLGAVSESFGMRGVVGLLCLVALVPAVAPGAVVDLVG